MTYKNSVKVVLASLFLLITPTMVWAAAGKDYEEVSYDDLLNELTSKKQKLQHENNTADNPRLHVGIGYANSFSNISTGGEKFSRHATGIQLNAGTDLISPEWYAEGIFRNYGTNSNGSEDFSLRELEGKIGYTNLLQNVWHYTISTGVSNRFMKFSDSTRNISVDESTPSLVISSGILAQVHKNLSIGAEVSGRTSMVNRSADQNSFDFAFRLNTSL
ncbi:hypothetical protein [Bdellovibrio svalbardensis]|uniref:Outer membrane beta-barrel domain-containing protein n=1 Tax=Bdellovibrio svalbardensis TaxID=2972972 RepID=A0ABT6DKR7_9BACT|nr:hypothetical protein [Bdellovibrio svalbardensis]MDG0817462.1 hypothetical protein [Bdellovibrio svalbardensis]